jgi:hypothetical protein
MLFNVIENIHKFIYVELFVSRVAATVHLVDGGLHERLDAVGHEFGDGATENGRHCIDHGTVEPIDQNVAAQRDVNVAGNGCNQT